MERNKFKYSSLFCIIVFFRVNGGAAQASTLFVFGDSYVVTRSVDRGAVCWQEPYGITYPGHPSGRYSDGLVLTDYVAMFLGLLESPIHYEAMNSTDLDKIQTGMSFAYGGTGVFGNSSGTSNLGDQVDLFKQCLVDGVYSTADLQGSVALVSITGADYSALLSVSESKNPQALLSYMEACVNQLMQDVTRLHDLGIETILVTSVPPLGSLPSLTHSLGYQNYSATANSWASFHNFWLQQAINEFNAENGHGDGTTPFIYMDLFNAYLFAFEDSATVYPGNVRFESPIFKPCCIGMGEDSTCGSIDAEGNKLYSVCDDPTSAFFWDSEHLTQSGWRAILTTLQSTTDSLVRCLSKQKA
ncbi:GDSL esterase/lipase-like protein [Drosera capensis]